MSIKKTSLSLFLISLFNILAFLFISCDNFLPKDLLDAQIEEPVWTDVEYSEDGKSVTIYFPGAGRYVSPAKAGRALNLPLAQLGHDFFEVVFLANSTTAARASWKRGQIAGVSGVVRELDYGNAIFPPPPGKGSAVLFVGNEADKTLLAVGKLTHVDNGDGLGSLSGSFISASAKSVTFTVDALKSGASLNTNESSFLTAAGGNPDHTTVTVGNTLAFEHEIAFDENKKYKFPIFEIARGLPDLRTQYTLDTNSGNFAAINDAIILSDNGKSDKKEPRYSTPDGNTRDVTILFLDDQTIITMPDHDAGDGGTNANDVGLPVKNPITLDFDTRGTREGAVFSLVFEIPVHALTNITDILGKKPVQWFIRPGYGTNMYNLDDGKGNAGGAILCGNGYVRISQGARMVVVVPPSKYQYNYRTGGTGSNFVYELFDVSGIIVELRDEGGHTIKPILVTDPGLVFLIGGYRIVTPFEFRDYYGLVWIEVGYDDPTVNFLYHGESFPVLVTTNNINVGGTDSGFINFTQYASTTAGNAIGNDRREYISTFDWNDLDSRNGINIFIIDANFDITGVTFNNLRAGLFMFVTNNASRTLGRNGDAHFIHNSNTWHAYSQFYFGKWPFPEPLTIPRTLNYNANPVPANVVNTTNFRINAGGSYVDWQTGANKANGRMIRGFSSGRITNVRVELPESVEVSAGVFVPSVRYKDLLF